MSYESETEAFTDAVAKSLAIRHDSVERRAKLAATREILATKLDALGAEVERAKAVHAEVKGGSHRMAPKH